MRGFFWVSLLRFPHPNPLPECRERGADRAVFILSDAERMFWSLGAAPARCNTISSRPLA
jgi:hypothetical protein